ncbi:MAG: hypothetical protein M3347_14625, partial [Armatimonadota bacterium]|nr:hypothetical protein [Armatimonadota bacterium]
MTLKHTKTYIAFILSILAPVVLAGCVTRQETASNSASSAPGPVPATATGPVQFTDITEAAGIKFVHNNAAFGLKFLPETMHSGVAFIDYDSDGYQDIFFVNGRDWTDAEIEAYRSRPWTRQEIERRRRVQPTGMLARMIP